jgi:hypothetical protein
MPDIEAVKKHVPPEKRALFSGVDAMQQWATRDLNL